MDTQSIRSFIDKLEHLLASEDNTLRGFTDPEFEDFSARDITGILLYVSGRLCGYKINAENVGKVEIQEYSVLDRERLEGTCIKNKTYLADSKEVLYVIVAAIDEGVIIRLAKDLCSTLKLIKYKVLKDCYVAQDGSILGTEAITRT